MNITDDEVLSCHFCGGLLNRASRGMIGRMRYGDPRLWWVLIVVVVLFSFAFYWIL
jgi:hypothetical protein